MENKDIKVFVKNNNGTFRRILSKDQYKLSSTGQIILPENHYSRGYVERIVSGIKWENFPLFLENINNKFENINLNTNNDIDFFLDNN